jgi:hypothetical protein
MTRDLAEKLLVYVNDRNFMAALVEYAYWREQEAMKLVKAGEDLLAMGRAQGALYEMEALRKLREAVLTRGKRDE